MTTAQFRRMMRMLSILLFAASMTAYATGKSQTVTINGDNLKLKQIFTTIEQQTGYVTLSWQGDLKVEKTYSLHVNNLPLKDLLDMVLADVPLRYTIKDKTIFLSEKKDARKAVETVTKQPEIPVGPITVKVVDSTGTALSGASVTNSKSRLSAISDGSGNCTMQVQAGDILVVSYVGFHNYSFRVTENMLGSNGITIKLSPVEARLDEVEVTINTGFQNVSKDKVTGTVQVIDEKTLQLRPTMDIISKLEGMAAGLATFRGGYVEVRGKNTINGNVSPLYVVDGFPISTGLGSINPEDIETVYVLSDAAATAQWGVQASNGVVIITTKKAKKGSSKVEFSSFVNIQDKRDFSKMPWLSNAEEIDLDQEYMDKGWFNWSSLLSLRRPLNLLQQANVYRLGLSPDGSKWTEQTFNNYVNELKTYDASKQWEELMLRKAVVSSSTLSLSTTTESHSLYASILYNKNLSESIGSENDRITLNLSDNFRLGKKVSFLANINATMTNGVSNGSGAGTVENTQPYERLVDEFGRPVQYYEKYDYWTSKTREAMPGYFSYSQNDLEERKARDNNSENFNIRAQFGVDYEIVRGLKLSTKYQYERAFSKTDNFNSLELPSQRVLVNDLYVPATKVYQMPLGSTYNFSRGNTTAFNWRNTLSYERRFGLHDVSVMTGFDMRRVYNEGMSDKVLGYNKQTTTAVKVDETKWQDGMPTWSGPLHKEFFYSTSNSDTRDIGFYMMPGYTFNKKYTVNANIRVDQRNLFGSDPQYRYKPLWSIGGAWLLSDESFMNNVTWADFVKLRASYGVTGNTTSLTSPYAQAGFYSTTYFGRTWDFLQLQLPANPQLKWEETVMTNVSVDFGILNRRLNGTISLYNERSNDLLARRDLDPTVGQRFALVNYASTNNKGMEISLNGSIISRKDWTWTMSGNISFNKNEVIDVEMPAATPANAVGGAYLEIGKPLTNIYSYNYGGLDEYGDATIIDEKGDRKHWKQGVANMEELLYFGPSTAPVYGGLQSTVAYKGFDFTFTSVFKMGAYFSYYPGSMYDGGLTSLRQNQLWADRWQNPGDELTTRVPRILYNGINPNKPADHPYRTETYVDADNATRFFINSQDYVMKANFWRFQDLILGYSLPTNARTSVVKGLRLTAQVSNPFFLASNKMGVNPDNPYGLNLKTYTFSLRATF